MNPSDTASNLDTIQVLKDHPQLLWVMTALFIVGLVADVALVSSLVRRRTGEGETPRFRVGPKPWGFTELGLVAFAIFSMVLIGWVLVSWMEKAGMLEGDRLHLAQLIVSAVAVNGLGIVGVAVLLVAARLTWREGFGIEWRGLGGASLNAVFYLLACLPPVWVMMVVSEKVCERLNVSIEPQDMARMFLDTDLPALRWGIALMALVGAPLFEELFFRGLVYPALKQRIGWLAAMALTSLVFALVHFHVLSFVPLVVLAIGLALAYELTGNLTVPILMHSAFNLMTVAQMVMVRT